MTQAGHPNGAAEAAGPGGTTRRAILEIARREISEHGIDGVSIRNIARRAGVDPRLVRHYYGSKERLLLHAVQVQSDPVALAEQILRGSRRRLGRQVATTLLGHWDSPRTHVPYRARLSASLTSDDVAALMRDEFVSAFFGTLTAAVSPDRHELRAALAAAQVIGLSLCRYLVDDPELSARSQEELVRLMGRTIQHYLTAELTEAASG